MQSTGLYKIAVFGNSEYLFNWVRDWVRNWK